MMRTPLSRVYVRGPDADALVVGARFYWHGRRHKWFLRLGGYYKMWCRLGFHFLHHSLIGDMWVCCCRRNFIYGEEIVP